MQLRHIHLSSLVRPLTRTFAKLDKSITDELNKEYTDLEIYYTKLKQSSKVIATTGRMQLAAPQFKKVMTLVKNENDLKLALEVPPSLHLRSTLCSSATSPTFP
jgi:hypothetical protein